MKGGSWWRQQELKPVQCRQRWEVLLTRGSSMPILRKHHTFLFWLIVTLKKSKGTSLQTCLVHLLWPWVVLLVALIGTESTSVSFKVLNFFPTVFLSAAVHSVSAITNLCKVTWMFLCIFSSEMPYPRALWQWRWVVWIQEWYKLSVFWQNAYLFVWWGHWL